MRLGLLGGFRLRVETEGVTRRNDAVFAAIWLYGTLRSRGRVRS